MLKSSLFAISILLVLYSSSALAKAPYLELFTLPYNASTQQCKTDARDALQQVGFKLTSSSSNQDVVGVKDNYKGVVSCQTIDVKRVIVVVTGERYKTARAHAIKIVDVLMPSY